MKKNEGYQEVMFRTPTHADRRLTDCISFPETLVRGEYVVTLSGVFPSMYHTAIVAYYDGKNFTDKSGNDITLGVIAVRPSDKMVLYDTMRNTENFFIYQDGTTEYSFYFINHEYLHMRAVASKDGYDSIISVFVSRNGTERLQDQFKYSGPAEHLWFYLTRCIDYERYVHAVKNQAADKIPWHVISNGDYPICEKEYVCTCENYEHGARYTEILSYNYKYVERERICSRALGVWSKRDGSTVPFKKVIAWADVDTYSE